MCQVVDTTQALQLTQWAFGVHNMQGSDKILCSISQKMGKGMYQWEFTPV